MTSPQEISDLVARFEDQFQAYKSPQYKEAQLRQDFTNPFFRELGWDVENKQGHAQAYREVIHEDALRIGGGVKAPDYCFRVGGVRKFFVETKKPSIDLSGDFEPAYQLRRYAWSAKLPLSVLTNFEDFAVYDCRVKPSKDDAPSRARILHCSFRDYATRWGEISAVFSKEAILRGSFDKFAEENRAKRGTAEVDEDFLTTIEMWRADLARNLALRNPKLAQRELNFAVQRIIDRIIFLRICEDRGIERYGQLLGLAGGQRIYRRLCERFLAADVRYNSGLFHFKAERDRREPPDALTLKLEVDDKQLREMLEALYYPDSPYEFSVISADILGHVYEQFLGKLIRLTEGHRAIIEDKPAVKKAGGVFYTPTYIVDYIVQHTIGDLINGKTPRQVEKLRILDPACGSGSFLIAAYQFLLDWHLDWYVRNDPQKWVVGKRPVLVNAAGGWRLAISERKRILLANIYGIDVDPQAAEVTKLSLLLKVLEGESEQTLQPLLFGLNERALPDLGDNIKCGNSLIGRDFNAQGELELSDDDQFRLNVFDWKGNYGFPTIISGGGFDAVIGNPPYVRIQGFPRSQIEYFSSKYNAATGNYDIYVNFVERAFNLLTKGGRLTFILPNKFFRTDYGSGLKEVSITKASGASYS